MYIHETNYPNGTSFAVREDGVTVVTTTQKRPRLRTYYCVCSCFYDDGRVTANIVDVVEATRKPKNTSREGRRCDSYSEWFASKAEALEVIDQARKA